MGVEPKISISIKNMKSCIYIFGVIFLGFTSSSFAQKAVNPLDAFSYYMGTWSLPGEHSMISSNPKMAAFKVIDFSWGKNHRVIWLRTGMFSDDIDEIFSEGMITYNPNTSNIVWLEYQIQNEILFEGVYTFLPNKCLERVYTVYYAENYTSIPLPELPAWTRKFRETFTPVSDNEIDWLTEVWVNNQWKKHGRNGGHSKAVRD